MKIFLLFAMISLICDNRSAAVMKCQTPSTQDSSEMIRTDYALKATRDEIMGNIAIFASKEKMALVWKDTKIHYPSNQQYAFEEDRYSLWQIDMRSGGAKRLVKFEDGDTGIIHPSWSPDGKWIAFGTFSISGHSPATTTRTWVVDSTGNGLQEVRLPLPYGDYGNYVVKWAGDYRVIIQGGIGGENSGMRFIYDCETKYLKAVK